MPIIISATIEEKLKSKHSVTRKEIEQCFENRENGLLEDAREEHKSDPPTQWFLSYTNKNRVLKIIFVRNGKDIYVKSAYEPIENEIRIYQKYAM